MKLSLLSSIGVTLLCIFSSAAAANYQCQLADLEKTQQKQNPFLKKLNLPKDTIIVESDENDVVHGEQITFKGNVVIYQQSQTVLANQAVYKEKQSQFLAEGNVKLNSSAATVEGESIFIDEKNKDFKLVNAEYKLGFNAGRGTAESFNIDGISELSLTEATFTTCPGEDPSWLFSSSEINISQEEGWGEAWNTVFKIADIPVLYLPYVTFPITDKRKSGLLFPKLGSNSRLGAYYSQPIYLNFAPNYDMTFTPSFMSERGWLWKVNSRYLSEHSDNLLQLEYMNEDDELPELEERYLSFVQHQSYWSDNWMFQLQWTELSDYGYISDFNSDYHHQADTHLNNLAQLSYQTEQFSARLLSQNIVELGLHSPSYKVPAQLELDWNTFSSVNGFGFGVRSSFTQFENEFVNEHQVFRSHIEPELRFNYHQPAFQFEASASYLATHYRQQFQDRDETQTVDRGVGKFRLLAGLNFEKFGRYFGEDVRQTLEPKIQYLYIEESDQSQINLYDSQRLKEDYFALFRSQTFSSIDRIEALNQVTLGVSSSIFNQNNQEIFRLGVAQVHELDDKIDLSGTNTQEVDSKPALAIEVFGQLSDNWQIDGGILYDRTSKKANSGFIALDYWLDEDKNLQINHRYVRDVANTTINQTGLFGSYKLNDQWSVAASYHYDSERDINLDGVIGFEYRSCCWSVQVSAQRQVVLDLNRTDFDNDGLVQYENGIGINFRFQGLGGEVVSDISKLFSDSIFAYRRPYLITK